MGNGRGGLFEHAGVSLDEEDVEKEVEGERTEVYECREESPELRSSQCLNNP